MKTVLISLENKQGIPIYLSSYKLSPMSSSLFSQQNLLPYCQPFCILGEVGREKEARREGLKCLEKKKRSLTVLHRIPEDIEALDFSSSMNVTGEIDSELYQPEGPTPYIHRYIKEG